MIKNFEERKKRILNHILTLYLSLKYTLKYALKYIFKYAPKYALKYRIDLQASRVFRNPQNKVGRAYVEIAPKFPDLDNEKQPDNPVTINQRA